MRPYADLSLPARFRRLRRLAVQALATWGVHTVRLRPLTFWENATFRIDTASGSFLLRVHRPGYRSLAQIQGELLWLEGLAERSGLPVQQPVQAPIEVAVDGVPEPRICTLLTWLPGRIHCSPSVAHCRAAGVTMGRLHRASVGWRPDLARPVWDGSDVFRMPTDPRVLTLLPDTDWRTWARGLARLATIQEALGREPDAFGLVHVDLHFNNLVFYQGVAVPIDFDDGGWGHFALDLATPWVRVRRTPHAETGWQAWLAGYRSVRPLEPAWLDRVSELAVLEPLMLAGWLEGQMDRPQAQSWPQEKLPELVAEVRKLLRQG